LYQLLYEEVCTSKAKRIWPPYKCKKGECLFEGDSRNSGNRLRLIKRVQRKSAILEKKKQENLLRYKMSSCPWEVSSLENSPIYHVSEYNVSQWHWKLSGCPFEMFSPCPSTTKLTTQILELRLTSDNKLHAPGQLMHSFSSFQKIRRKWCFDGLAVMWLDMTFLEGEHSIPTTPG
jgi:hypothetical protein